MENLNEGFRFRPTDAEALSILLRFIVGEEMNDSGFISTNVDNHGVPCSDDDDCTQYRFFITKLKKKSKSKYNRTVGNKGSWKQQNCKPVCKNGGPVIGYKRNITYKNKNCNLEIYGHWLMKEYQLSDVTMDAICKKFNDEEHRHWVLFAIKKTPATNPIGRNLESVEEAIRRMLKRRSEAAKEQSMYQLEEFLMSDTDESGMRPEIEQQIAIWSTNALIERNNQQEAEEEDSCIILVHVPEITTQEEEHAAIFNWTYDASIITQEEDTALIFNPNDWGLVNFGCLCNETELLLSSYVNVVKGLVVILTTNCITHSKIADT
ncbi:unnamed protein product [Withania somnifera]